MGSAKKAAAPPLLPREQLKSVVRSAIHAASGLKSTNLKKALSKSNRLQHEQALAIARELVERGEIYRWAKGSAEWFFASEPIAALEKAVRVKLSAGTLSTDMLQQSIALETKIPKPCFDEWKKNALAGGLLYEVAAVDGAATKTKAKHLALEPDLRAALKKAIAELRKGLVALDAKGIPRERIAHVLWEELKLPLRRSRPSALQPCAQPRESLSPGPQRRPRSVDSTAGSCESIEAPPGPRSNRDSFGRWRPLAAE